MGAEAASPSHPGTKVLFHCILCHPNRRLLKWVAEANVSPFASGHRSAHTGNVGYRVRECFSEAGQLASLRTVSEWNLLDENETDEDGACPRQSCRSRELGVAGEPKEGRVQAPGQGWKQEGLWSKEKDQFWEGRPGDSRQKGDIWSVSSSELWGSQYLTLGLWPGHSSPWEHPLTLFLNQANSLPRLPERYECCARVRDRKEGKHRLVSNPGVADATEAVPISHHCRRNIWSHRHFEAWLQ